MTDIDSMIAVLQAAKEGKVIQYRMGNEWLDSGIEPFWNFRSNEYRVKPEPVVLGLQVGATKCGKFLYEFSNPNLELTFEEGVLVGAKVL